MAKQQLLAYPYMEELVYREKIDPYKMNLMLRSIEESVLRCILRGSESQDFHNDLDMGVNASYLGLAAQANKFLHYQSVQSGVAFATSFDNVITFGARSDYVGGITTLGWDTNRQATKIPRYDSDNDGIPDQVSPSVTVLVDNVARPTDDKVYNCLNRSNKSFWIEETTVGEHTIEIQLPPSLNKRFNYIELAPFPVFGMKIKRVEYQNIYSNWTTIFDNLTDQYRFYNDMGPLVMHLAPKETTGSFKITVEALAGIGAIGFSSIDIALIDYRDEVQTAYIRFNNLKGSQIITLDTIDIDFYIDETTAYGSFITEVALTNRADTATETKVPVTTISNETFDLGGQTLSLGSNEYMYLKVVMKENNMTSPVIRGARLNYEV